MTRLRHIIFGSAVLLAIIQQGAARAAAPVIFDPQLELLFRGSPVQPFPLAVDSAGAIYTVTGTSVSDDFVKLSTNGTLTTLNPSVGFVVGVFADLEIGFEGDFFANAGTPDLAQKGVVRFNKTTGNASLFYGAAPFNADGGLAFDPISQTLYQQSQAGGDLVGLNSSGSASVIVPNADLAFGMTFGSDGMIKVINQQKIYQVDPVTHQVNTIVDLASSLPGFLATSISTDTASGGLLFGGQMPSGGDGLYRSNSDGSGISLLATFDHDIRGLAVGPRGDGLAGRSIYFSSSATHEFFELRPIPEPSTIVLATFAVLWLSLRMQRMK